MRASGFAKRLNRQLRFIGRTTRPPKSWGGDALEVSAKEFAASVEAIKALVFLMKSRRRIVICPAQWFTILQSTTSGLSGTDKLRFRSVRVVGPRHCKLTRSSRLESAAP